MVNLLCSFIICMVSPSGPSDEYLTYLSLLLSIIGFFNMQVPEFSYESSLPFIVDWVP